MMLEFMFVIYSSYIYIELIASLGAYVKDVIYASEGDSHSVESAPLSSPTTPALSKKKGRPLALPCWIQSSSFLMKTQLLKSRKNRFFFNLKFSVFE